MIDVDWSKDEQQVRVAKYLEEITGGAVGAGEDPVGFLIASHAHAMHLVREANKVMVELAMVGNGEDGEGVVLIDSQGLPRYGGGTSQ